MNEFSFYAHIPRLMDCILNVEISKQAYQNDNSIENKNIFNQNYKSLMKEFLLFISENQYSSFISFCSLGQLIIDVPAHEVDKKEIDLLMKKLTEKYLSENNKDSLLKEAVSQTVQRFNSSIKMSNAVDNYNKSVVEYQNAMI